MSTVQHMVCPDCGEDHQAGCSNDSSASVTPTGRDATIGATAAYLLLACVATILIVGTVAAVYAIVTAVWG